MTFLSMKKKEERLKRNDDYIYKFLIFLLFNINIYLFIYKNIKKLQSNRNYIT